MYTSSGPTVVLVWALTCGIVFYALDLVATRPVEIALEDHRRPGATDDDALLAAVQEARRRGDNWWWIHDSRPVILLDGAHAYDLDPRLLRQVEVPVLQHRARGWLPLFSSVPAVRIR